MSRKKKLEKPQIALCYVRQSYSRDDDDTNSPERQRANIIIACEQHGWEMEWYEDVGGHKSGRTEKGRPAWLALKKRLTDDDVVALVANDLSRLHRKGWRVGDLLEYLEKHEVALVTAAPGRSVDTATHMGKMYAQMGAFFDEYYCEDIARRAKDSIAHRKRLGKTVGMPPFGTTRNEAGYLIPATDGAWLLPDGTYQVADDNSAPPHPDAVWRGYYECTQRILELFAENNRGMEKIAYAMNNDGWVFRTRDKQPRAITRDDIRRIVANWPEYGGMAPEKKAKDRPAYEQADPQEIPFNHDRAVFDIELLRRVAQVRQARTWKPKDDGKNRKAYAYPLSVLTVCAHCEKLANQEDDPNQRTTLTGRQDANGTRRYKHRTGVTCGTTNRSVPCDVLEDDFERLVKLLTLKPDMIDLMTELAIQMDQGGISEDEAEFEAQKHAAIAKCRRRIDAAINLYRDGTIDRATYIHDIEQNEREIAHWEARTTDTQRIAIELAMCVEALERVANTWNTTSPERQQNLARGLFEYIVYDLDVQRIVDFKLKAWADRFLMLRASLYPEVEMGPDGEIQVEKYPYPDDQDMGNPVPHRGLEPLF
jgi:DNA invertase Pin-like site-specific DNA recombinase